MIVVDIILAYNACNSRPGCYWPHSRGQVPLHKAGKTAGPEQVASVNLTKLLAHTRHLFTPVLLLVIVGKVALAGYQ